MSTRGAFSIGGFFFLTCAMATNAANYCRQVDFNASPAGAYTRQNMSNDFGGNIELWDDGLTENRASIAGGGATGNCLKVTYPSGQVGGSLSGTQFAVNLPRSDSMFLEYKVKFDDTFDWVKGGKLPGLAGGTKCSGGESPTGYNGWSTRYMWREGGVLHLYTYTIGEVGTYHALNVTISKGAWHTVKQFVKMNTIGSKNGIVKTWIDGTLAATVNTIEFTKTDTLKCDKFFFSTFYGGDSKDWAPSQNEISYFDDIKVSSNDAAQCAASADTSGALFDDFEDGNLVNSFGGPWVVFNDSTGGGKSKATLTFENGFKGSKSARIAFTLDKGTMTSGAFIGFAGYLTPAQIGWDLSSVTGVNFSYKGGSVEVVCRIESDTVKKTPKEPYHRVTLTPSTASDWTAKSYSISEFYQPAWSGITPIPLSAVIGKITRICFQIKGSSTATAPVNGELWLDEIRLPGLTNIPTSAAFRPAAGRGPQREGVTFSLVNRHVVIRPEQTGPVDIAIVDARGVKVAGVSIPDARWGASYKIALPQGMSGAVYFAQTRSASGSRASMMIMGR